MFCYKCGSKVDDGAAFCQNCGTKLIAEDPAQQAATPAGQAQQQNAPSDMPKKKKFKKLSVLLGAVALVIVAAIAMNWNGKIDYEATVRAHQPFEVSEGLSCTYGEVLDQYISSPDWKVRNSGDVNYVDISGKAKGTDSELLVTIKVTPDAKDPELASIAPESITVDGEKSPTQDDAVDFLFSMFSMYEKGDNDLSPLLSDDTANKLLYKGVPVDQLLGASYDEMVSALGEPDESNYGGEALVYGSSTISFDLYSNVEPYLTSIYSESLDDFTYNGQPLTGNYDELTKLFGREPDDARVFYDTYSMTYNWDHMGTSATLAVDVPATTESTATPQVSVSWWIDTPESDTPTDYEQYQEPQSDPASFNAPQDSARVSFTDLLGTWQWQGKDIVDAALGIGGTNQLTLYSNGTCEGGLATSGSVNNEFVMTFYPDAWSFLEYEQVLQVSAMTTGWDWDSNGTPIEVPVYKTMNFKVSMAGNILHLENVDNPDSKNIEYTKVG